MATGFLKNRPRHRSAFDVRIHREVAEWLAEETQAGPRTRFRQALDQLLARGTTTNRKSVRGDGAGWWRTGLGGNGGYQFYLWWAVAGSPALRELSLPDNVRLLRAVRHHDETSEALHPGRPEDWEAFRWEDVPDVCETLSPDQSAIILDSAVARSLRGAPGSGKTIALFADVVRAAPGRGLYVTYGSTLCANARQWFETHAPADVEVVVFSMDELTETLAAAREHALPLSLQTKAAVARFTDALAAVREPLGVWGSRPRELYAEMHAHLIGRATIDDEFTRSPNHYKNARQKVLDESDAQTVLAVAKKLSSTLPELFPAPARARAALQALRSHPLPPILSGLDWIWVDEVQDLTSIEFECILALQQKNSSPDRPTRIFIAGDEGQTVRPTDFLWSETNNALNDRVGQPRTGTLQSNLRSPASIARVVTAIGGLYKSIEKSDRPSGSIDTGADDVAPGRVLLCRYEDQAELEELRALISDTPDATLIALNPDEGAGALSPEEAKGQEFRIAVLLHPGAHLERIEQLAKTLKDKRSPLESSWLRADIDRLRVAASRATDILVFVDSRHDANAASALRKILPEDIDGIFVEHSVEDLRQMLSEDLGNAAEIVDALVADALRALDTTPEDALRKGRRAVSLLGNRTSAAGVSDPDLRKQAHRVRGLGALSLALSTDASGARKLFDEANRALHRAECTEAARGVLALRDFTSAVDQAPKRAQELSASLSKVEAQVPEIAAAYVQGILRAARDFANLPLPTSSRDQLALVDAFEHLSNFLSARFPHLRDDYLAMKRKVGIALAESGQAEQALKLLETLDPREWRFEANCHLKRKNWSAAAVLFEKAQMPADAIAAYREGANIQEALRVMRTSGIEDQTLQWLGEVYEAIGSGPPAPLTTAEDKAVRALLKDALTQTNPSEAA